MAMRLHTKDQAPKEGEQQAPPQPFQKVAAFLYPNRLRHLVP